MDIGTTHQPAQLLTTNRQPHDQLTYNAKQHSGTTGLSFSAGLAAAVGAVGAVGAGGACAREGRRQYQSAGHGGVGAGSQWQQQYQE